MLRRSNSEYNLITELTSSSLPNSDYTKFISLISEDDLKEFLDFTLNSRGIKEINSLFALTGINLHNNLPLVILNLYNEDISCYNLASNLNNLNKVIEFKSLYVRNYIRELFTNRVDCNSYKDENNIKAVMANIYNEILSDNERALLNNLGVSVTDTENTFYNYLVRINGKNATCENNIVVLSAILNYSMYSATPAYIPTKIETIFKNGTAKELLISIFQKIMCRTINYTIIE